MKSIFATVSNAARNHSTGGTSRSGKVHRSRIITNSRVSGDELLVAVAFLSDALNLPALNPDADRTARSIDLGALLRAAA